MIAKLRQADVLIAQGQSVADVIRSLGVTEVTYDRWRKEFGGLKTDQGGLLLRLVQGQISGLQLGATGSVYTRHTVETLARTGSRPAIEVFYGARETIVVDAA